MDVEWADIEGQAFIRDGRATPATLVQIKAVGFDSYGVVVVYTESDEVVPLAEMMLNGNEAG